MVVEVALVLGHDRDCVALVDDEDPVEEFAADAAHESLGDGVRPWRPEWSLDHLDSGAGEHGVEVGGELRVAVADEEPEAIAGDSSRGCALVGSAMSRSDGL
jgi:hypothetical protein